MSAQVKHVLNPPCPLWTKRMILSTFLYISLLTVPPSELVKKSLSNPYVMSPAFPYHFLVTENLAFYPLFTLLTIKYYAFLEIPPESR